MRPTPNGCVDDLLAALVNGTLDAGSAARVQAHLGRCARCRRERDGWAAIARAVDVAQSRLLQGVAAAAPKGEAKLVRPPRTSLPSGTVVPISAAAVPRAWAPDGDPPRQRPVSRATGAWSGFGLVAAALLVVVVAVAGGRRSAGDDGGNPASGERRLAAVAASPPSGEEGLPAGCSVTPREELPFVFHAPGTPAFRVVLRPEVPTEGRIFVRVPPGTPFPGMVGLDDRYFVLDPGERPIDGAVVEVREGGAAAIRQEPRLETPSAALLPGRPGQATLPEADLPEGEPAPRDVVAAMTATLYQVNACSLVQEGENYGTVARRVFALYSDDFFRRFAAAPEEVVNWAPHSFRDLGIRAARLLADGRVGGIIDDPNGQGTFLVFVRQGDRYVIDEFVNLDGLGASITATPTVAVGTPIR